MRSIDFLIMSAISLTGAVRCSHAHEERQIDRMPRIKRQFVLYPNQILIDCHAFFKTPHDRVNLMKDILLHAHINAFMTDFNNGEAVLKECTTGIRREAFFSATEILSTELKQSIIKIRRETAKEKFPLS